MKPFRFVALWALTFASVLVAQDHPEVAGIHEVDLGSPLELEWSQSIIAAQGALRWVEQPGDHTLLMVHTTVDKPYSNDLLHRGITQTLPFLAPPPEAGWATDIPELDAYQKSGHPLMIPPLRLAAFVDQFVQSQYAPGFGTHNDTTEPVLRHAALSHLADPILVTDKTDERQPWLKSIWSPTPDAFESFDTKRLGYESVMQMALEHAHQEALVFDEDAVDTMLKEVDKYHGFDVYVQAIVVRPPVGPGGRVQLHYKRFTRIRHHSLFALEELLSLGPPRHVISPLNEEHYMYLAPLGDRMHIVFPFQVSFHDRPAVLRAYVPTTNGYVLVPQLVNESVLDGEVLKAKGPKIAQFEVPSNATSGWVWIEDSRFPGTAVVPEGAVPLDGGLSPAVWITAYQ